MNSFDLEKLKEENKKLKNPNFLKENAENIADGFALFGMFMNGLVGFLMSKDLNKKFNMIIRGSQEEIDSLKNALIYNKLLLKKIETGMTHPTELDAIRAVALENKNKFESLTGIKLPF